ncbi:MAG TPA: NnrU family protein [Acidimicrobiales bacterium]|nr:NnrU family protein [Acidimicrobiales bacterium]
MALTQQHRLLALLYAVLAYAGFLAAVAWAVAFLADWQLPRGIDHGARHSVPTAVIIDLALLLLFAVQHSVMARTGFKRWLGRFLPEPMERSTYVLAASAVLLLLFWQWQAVTTPVWDVHDAAGSGAIWSVYALGWLIAIGSTFMIDHFDFFGLRRAYRYSRQERATPMRFVERWLYGWVRHPLMLGLLLAFWATPHMTAGHLLFAVSAFAYIAVGVRFEEHDLERELGDVYRDYAERVPALLPLCRPTSWRRSEATAAVTEAPNVAKARSSSTSS